MFIEMEYKKLVLTNKLGLHLRAASKLSNLATNFQSDIFISNGDGDKINAKSVLGITLLAAAFGTSVYIEASGEDEKEAINEIEKLFNSKFGEES
tara:strand:+ start:123 stop:407 length:285 start_codon:yes stop_codon:yes gene_type:complete